MKENLSVSEKLALMISICNSVDPVTNDLASARQNLLVAECRWSQEWVFVVKFAGAAAGLMSG